MAAVSIGSVQVQSRWILALSAISLVKLWSVYGQAVAACTWAAYDDRLFVTLAQHLANGQWLGPYDHLTLIKGPMYPIWLAFTYRIGLPLLLAQHLLYIGACLALVLALKDVISQRSIRAILYAGLLFNPASAGVLQQPVLRDGFYVSLMIGILACLVGLYSARSSCWIRFTLWALALGVCFSAFWLTREEGLWFLPCFLLLLGSTAITVWRSAAVPQRYLRAACSFGMPLGIWVLALLTISLINYNHYEFWGTVETTHPDFEAAMGALQRVEPKMFKRYVPVTKETRQRIYSVSPSFREVKPFLEGRVGEAWARICMVPGMPPLQGEIAGGWFFFAFRDATAAAGYHHNGKEAMGYYARVAREVNLACDQGQLKCGPPSSSLRPPWRMDYLPLLINSFYRHIQIAVFVFQDTNVNDLPSSTDQAGDRKYLETFAKITQNRLAPTSDNQELVFQFQQERVHQRRLLCLISSLYKILVPIGTAIAILGFIVTTAIRAIQRRIVFLFILNSCILGSFLVRVLLISYLDVASFPSTMYLRHLVPCYALILIFSITAMVDLIQVLPIGKTRDLLVEA